jgi:hypothetical protein
MKQGESDRNVHTPPLAASANLLAVGGRARVDERQYVVLLRADAAFEKWRAAFARGDVPLKDLISAGAVTSVPRGASVHILAIEGGLARVEVDGLNWQGWVRTKHLVTEQ